MGLTPGSTQTTTTVTSAGGQEAVTVTGLSAAEMVTVQNLSSSPIVVNFNGLAGPTGGGIQIGAYGGPASSLTLTPDGEFSSIPMPSADVFSLWCAMAGKTIEFTVWS